MCTDDNIIRVTRHAEEKGVILMMNQKKKSNTVEIEHVTVKNCYHFEKANLKKLSCS